jgi:acyl-coenzyme A synthetase/AMP-(fatty) acid ligase
VVFGPLPKTSTGKIQKYVLREQAKTIRTLGSLCGLRAGG